MEPSCIDYSWHSCCCVVLFNIAAVLLGFFYSWGAVQHAYRPSYIVVVGHHPLLLGFITFLTEGPKKIMLNYVKKVVKERVLGFEPEEYTYVVTELGWFFRHIAEPLPNAVVKVYDTQE